MPKHYNELDELIEAQERVNLPHRGLIRDGKLPYGTRQLLKHPGKAALLYLTGLPVLLVVVLGNLSRFSENMGDSGALITGITAAMVSAIYILIVISNYRKAKRLQKEQQAQKLRQKRRKKK